MLKALLGAALALGLSSAAASSQETLKIAVGQRGGWDTMLSEMGQQAGIFKKHGLVLDILYSQGGGETLQAVASRSVDIGVAAGTLSVLGAFTKGAPIRVIGAEITGSPNYWYVRADSPIRSLKDIDGRKVAISTTGSGTHSVVLTASRDNGVSPVVVPTGTVPATYTQVMSGQVDVGFAVPPFALDAVDKGEVRILFRDNDLKIIREQSSRLLIAHAAADRAVLQRYLDAYRETADWMYADPRAVTMFASIAGIPEATALRVRDEFYPKASIWPDKVLGIDQMVSDAVSFKFIAKPLTDAQLSELFVFGR